MSRMLRYALHPRGAFHFGERGVGLEETADLLHSDTLFAALVAAWRLLGAPLDARNAPALLAPFYGAEPPLRISSALPFAGAIPLFPRPYLPLGAEKALKHVAFVSPQALALLAQGVRLTRDRAEQELIQGGTVWVLPEERAQIVALLLAGEPDRRRRDQLEARFAREPARIELWWGGDAPPAPHVALDRLTSESNLFYAARLRFAHGCGLAFWVEVHDDDYQAQLEAALAFLQDEGVGGKRTSGHGQFVWERVEPIWPAAADPNAYLMLSLYHPSEDEVQRGVLDRAWYRRMLRRGWLFSPDGRSQRRKAVWMLREGTVLTQAALGTIVDLRPAHGLAHPVWRYGHALALPLEIAPDMLARIETNAMTAP